MKAIARVPFIIFLMLMLVVEVKGDSTALAQTPSERLLVRVSQRISDISWLSQDTILATLREPGRSQIATVNIGNGETKILASGWCPSLSPDRTRVAFIPGPASLGNVMILDLRTQQQRKLSDKIAGNCVKWSPDNRRVAVLSPVESGGRIVVISAETGDIQQTIDGGRYETIPAPLRKTEALNIGDPAWHPDAQRLVFAVSAPEIRSFSIFMISGGEPVVIYNYGSGYSINRIDAVSLRDQRRTQILASPRDTSVPNDLAYSPDGRLLLFTLGNEIFVYDGTASKAVTTGISPSWSIDGKSIVLSRGADCAPGVISSAVYCIGYDLYMFPFP